MTTFRSTLLAQLGWTWRDGPEAAPTIDSNRLACRAELGDGAENLAEAVWHAEDRQLAEGQSATFDLAALEQTLFGGTLTIGLSGVRAVLIVHRGPGGGTLLVGGAAGGAWHGPLASADDRLRVMPGGAVLLAHPRDGWPVEPGHALLAVEASGGDAGYDIAILGTTSGPSSSG